MYMLEFYDQITDETLASALTKEQFRAIESRLYAHAHRLEKEVLAEEYSMKV